MNRYLVCLRNKSSDDPICVGSYFSSPSKVLDNIETRLKTFSKFNKAPINLVDIKVLLSICINGLNFNCQIYPIEEPTFPSFFTRAPIRNKSSTNANDFNSNSSKNCNSAFRLFDDDLYVQGDDDSDSYVQGEEDSDSIPLESL